MLMEQPGMISQKFTMTRRNQVIVTQTIILFRESWGSIPIKDDPFSSRTQLS